MADLVSVVVAIGNGAKSLLQQLFFSPYAPLPCLKYVMGPHMVLNTASNNKANT